jgi:hypothetical protein
MRRPRRAKKAWTTSQPESITHPHRDRFSSHFLRKKEEKAMKIIDADAHMCEPPNLWVERIDTRFRERALRAVDEFGRIETYCGAPENQTAVEDTLNFPRHRLWVSLREKSEKSGTFLN